MSPLLGPILAQLVTLGMSDRTEARHIVAQDSYSEVATLPRVGLNFGWRRTSLSLNYGPSITVTPLEAKDPYVLVFHSGTLTLSQRWQRTTVSVTASGSAGRINLRTQALAGGVVTSTPVATPGGTAAPGGAMPPAMGGTGGTMQPGTMSSNTQLGLALDRPLTFVSGTAALNVNQLVSARLSITGGVSYFTSGSVDDDPNSIYPTVRGPGAQVSAAYRPTYDDLFTTYVITQLADSGNGNRAWLLSANEVWTHRLSRDTKASLGTGLSLTRNSQPIGYVFYSIYPNFLASITNMTRIGHSVLTSGAGAYSSPFIDPARGLVDPRLGANVFTAYNKDRFTATASAATGLQLTAGSGTGVLNTVTGVVNSSYRFGDALTLDSGVRWAWQALRGTTTVTTAEGTTTYTTVPVSLALYVALTVNLSVPLRGRH
jgi:hypothetical protein